MAIVDFPFAQGRKLRTTGAALLLILSLTAGKSAPLLADDQILDGRRGTLAVRQVDGSRQIVEWIGPGALQLAWPRLEWKATLISLRVVPTGLPQVGAFTALLPTRELSLCGVALADEDLDFIVTACPDLYYLWLRHPSTMPQDEFSDLTDEERAAFKSRTLSGSHLAKIAQLKHLTLLEIGGYALPSTRLQFLADLTQLRYLDLHDTKVTDEDLQSLSKLSRLEVLNLSGTEVTGRGLRFLHDCHSLECVILDRTPATDELAKSLTDNPLPSLKQLSLHACGLTPHGMSALQIAMPLFAKIDTFEHGFGFVTPSTPHDPQEIRLHRAACALLWNLGVGTFQADGTTVKGLKILSDRHWAGAWILSELSRFKGLKSLQLDGCPLSADAVEQLQRQDQLENLDLSNSSIDDAGLGQLAGLHQLKRLDLRNTKVTDVGLESLARLKDLAHLDLAGTKVTDRGLRLLPSLSRLNHLGLKNCQITDQGAQELARMASLEFIALDKTRVTDRGVAVLAKLPRLRGLNLINCHITDTGAAHLLGVETLETYGLAGTSVSSNLAMKLMRHASDVKAKSQPKSSAASADDLVPLTDWRSP